MGGDGSTTEFACDALTVPPQVAGMTKQAKTMQNHIPGFEFGEQTHK